MTNITSQRVAKVRKELGMSQAEFGKACGVTRAAVCSWETPERSNPTAKHIKKISLISGKPVSWFYNETVKASEGWAVSDSDQTGGVVTQLQEVINLFLEASPKHRLRIMTVARGL